MGGSTLGGLSDAENVQLGVVAALIEGLILQPTLYWKNAMAQNLPVSLNPFIMYRGTGAALCNEMGQMGLQFGLTGFFQHVYGANMTTVQEFSSATMGGAATAFFATPVEAIMIQQQRFGGALIGTSMRIITDFGFLRGGMMRGLEAAILRDSIYVSGLLGVTPIMQDYLMREHGMSTLNAGFWASGIGGILGAIPSHPLDVVKTCMQVRIYTRTLQHPPPPLSTRAHSPKRSFKSIS
jgi:hypothetical protein